ncbi:hypothetical protein F4861DRAFT_538306 [Xylaria intraflava]|nr:hypothetical protein F4861DRAFT_538306 [Xylaria intraflava]
MTSAFKGRKEFWNGDAHEALVIAFSRMHGSIKPEQQQILVKEMKDCGFETTWEGISCDFRYEAMRASSPPSPPSRRINQTLLLQPSP